MVIVMENNVVTIKRRKLVKEDLERMRLPKRYWESDINMVSEFSDKSEVVSPLVYVSKYIKRMDEMWKNGFGLLLWGSNGNGKTSAAAVIAKEYRRRLKTVLFIEVARIKDLVVSKEYFDEDETYWDRARTVDVLILDDLGKGVTDDKGFGKRLIDELIRTRNASKLITIITTNVVCKGKDEKLSYILKSSTMHSLKEHTMPIHFRGPDMRDRTPDAVKSFYKTN